MAIDIVFVISAFDFLVVVQTDTDIHTDTRAIVYTRRGRSCQMKMKVISLISVLIETLPPLLLFKT